MSSIQLNSDADLNRSHKALAHEYRRSVLTQLHGSAEPTSLSDLAEAIAADVEPVTAGRDGDLISRIRVQLHHNHLPKLADDGFVEYDGSPSYVAELTADGRELASTLSG